MPDNPKKTLSILFSMVLLDQMAAWMLLPLFAVLFTEPQSAYFILSSDTHAHTVGYLLLGWFYAAFPLAQFLTAPLLGEFSDKYGRKPILTFSACAITGGYALLLAAIILKNIPLLFVARILAGIGGGSIGVLFATTADFSPHLERIKNFGKIAAASGIGLVLGPLLSGLLSDQTLSAHFTMITPLYALIALGCINIFLVTYVLTETLHTANRSRSVLWRKTFIYIKDAYRLTHIRAVFLISFLFSAGLSIFITFGPVFILEHFHFSQSELGYFLGYFGLCIALTQMILIPPLSRKYSEERILGLGLLLTALGLAGLYISPQWHWMCAVTPVLATGVALSYTMITALLSLRTDPEHQGEILGVNTCVQALAFTVPGIFTGAVAIYISADFLLILAAFLVALGIYFVPRKTAQ